jgi:hypothetical protein
MNNRQKMRIANRCAIEYLNSLNFNYVCLIPHGYSYNQLIDGTIQKQIDIFGLFDGIAFKKIVGKKETFITYLQIKTNSLGNKSKYRRFAEYFDIPITLLCYSSKEKKISRAVTFLPKRFNYLVEKDKENKKENINRNI